MLAEPLCKVPRRALHVLPEIDNRQAVAGQQAGQCIECSVLWDLDSDTSQLVTHVTTFLKVVERAKTTSEQLSFQLIFSNSPESKRELFDSRRSLFESLLRAVGDALPYLVSLRLVLPEYARRYMDSVLCRPAPHLRDFAIRDFGLQAMVRAEPLIPLRSTLFSGNAPELRSVSLSSVPLPLEPIAAFQRVTHTRLDFDETFPELDVRRHFPALDSLHIAYNSVVPSARHGYVLRGLRLTSLTIDACDRALLGMIYETLDLPSIPIVRIYNEADDEHDWQATVRAEDRTEWHATISRPGASADDADEYVTAVLSLSRADLQREFCIREWSIDEPHALLSHGQGTGIVSLRMENIFIPGFLQSCVSLPALREIHIDLGTRGSHATMIWPSAWGVSSNQEYDGDYYELSCPSLETLTIVASERPMQIDGSEVLNLGMALELSDRPESERPRLMLRAVTFRNPTDLTDVFSSIQS